MTTQEIKDINRYLREINDLVNKIDNIVINVNDMDRWDKFQMALKTIGNSIDTIVDNTY